MIGNSQRFRGFSEFFGPRFKTRNRSAGNLYINLLRRTMMSHEAPVSGIVFATAKIVRAGESYVAEQGSIYRAGVSSQSVGSAVIWLGMISLPAGRRTNAHRHEGHETALHMTTGEEIEIWSGARLEHCERVRPGDYVFIPAGVPHVAVNRSSREAQFLGARNDPQANESVVLLPELDSVVP